MRKTIELRLQFGSDDFRGLLTGYNDNGYSKSLPDAIEHSILNSLNAQFLGSIIRCQVIVSPLADINVRGIFDTGELCVEVPRIIIDLPKDASRNIEGIFLTKGVRQGRNDWDGAFVNDSSIVIFKDMATRDRFEYRYVNLLFSPQILGFLQSNVDNCHCPKEMLRPLRRGPHNCDYITWACICCGEKYFCECSRGVPEYYAERIGYLTSDAQQNLISSSYKSEICHFCRDIPSTIVYRSRMYGSQVYSNYYPYMNEAVVLNNVDWREAENVVRERLGVPKIGEGWVAETLLFNTVRMLFPEYEVQREATPEWLGRQRFDIYFPQVGVAIEYQGEQHFLAIDFFGGEEGLRRAQERDKDKRRKAMDAGVTIVEFNYDETIDEEKIVRKVGRAIKAQLEKSWGA